MEIETVVTAVEHMYCVCVSVCVLAGSNADLIMVKVCVLPSPSITCMLAQTGCRQSQQTE